MYYIYVLWCGEISNEGRLYVGYTADLKERLKQHSSGATKTTRRFDKIELVYYEACRSEIDARRREKELKTGFGRGYLKRRLRDWFSGRTPASQA